MNKLFKTLGTIAAIAFFVTACAAQDVQAKPKFGSAAYEAVLGRSLTDTDVADFLARNNCSSVEQFELCKEIGMAFGINSKDVVETVFIYLEDVDGFTAYSGQLPFGLKSDERKETVEEKLKKQRVGIGGRNAFSMPDHTHVWATYYSAGMTIIYNSPSPDDQGATMHAILLRK